MSYLKKTAAALMLLVLSVMSSPVVADPSAATSTTATSTAPTTSDDAAAMPQSHNHDSESGTEEADRFTGDLLNMLMTLLVFIGVIVVLSWLLKRMLHSRQQHVNAQSSIKVLEQRSLSQKTTLYLLDIEGETFAIAEGVHGVSLLAKLAEAKPSFREILEKK